MKLMVHERLALFELLPRKGNYEALKSIRVARETLSFTPEEIEFFELKQEGGVTNWNKDKAAQRVLDAPLEEYIVKLFRKKLSEMEQKGELTEQYVSVYEKFVINYRAIEA